MDQQMPAQNNPIRTRLLAAMQDGIFAHCERLPRESVLAEQLGISRTQLRDSLATLEREGFITRRHGVGTMINRHVLSVQTRMDIEVEFMDMIRQAEKPLERSPAWDSQKLNPSPAAGRSLHA